MQELTYNEITEDAYNTPLKNQKEELIDLWNKEIIPSIVTQIYDLNELGVNILSINNVDVLDVDFFVELIQYCDENYISIQQLDDILSNELKLNLFGRYIYEFYAVDCLHLISTILSISKYKSNLQLINLNSDELKDLFFKAISFKLEILNHLSPIESDIKGERTKYMFYLDLVDNDLTNFIENYLRPITAAYTIA